MVLLDFLAFTLLSASLVTHLRRDFLLHLGTILVREKFVSLPFPMLCFLALTPVIVNRSDKSFLIHLHICMPLMLFLDVPDFLKLLIFHSQLNFLSLLFRLLNLVFEVCLLPALIFDLLPKLLKVLVGLCRIALFQ